MKRMTPRQLKKFILAEADRLSETLEQGKSDTEDVDAKEVDAEKLAKTLEKDVNFMKALAKIDEAKKTLRTRIMKRLV